MAGGLELGLGAGVGASIAGTLIQDLNAATVGNSQLDAGQAITISATATQNLTAGSVDGGGAFLASIAGSITLNSLVGVTTASTASGAQLDKNIPTTANESILIHSQDTSSVLGGAGVLSGSLLGNLSPSVDASITQKNTSAVLGGRVTIGGNINVEAISNETVTSVVGTKGLSLLASIAGAGSLHRLNVTTSAYVDSGANVSATGNIRISADEHSSMNLSADESSFSGLGSAGASLAAIWNTKVTQAYIAGADPNRSDPFNQGSTLGAAMVQANGATPAIAADDGSFNVSFQAPGNAYGEVQPPAGNVASALESVFNNPILTAISSAISSLFNLATNLDTPSLDPSLTQQRISTPQTSNFQGLSVTATTQEDDQTLARGISGAISNLGIAPQLSGSAAVVGDTTSAFIAAGCRRLACKPSASRRGATSITWALPARRVWAGLPAWAHPAI